MQATLHRHMKRQSVLRILPSLVTVGLVLFAVTEGCFVYFLQGWVNEIELTGAQFDAVHLDEISRCTGLTFPAGAVGLYYYFEAGIDGTIVAKISIPREKRAEFVAN